MVLKELKYFDYYDMSKKLYCVNILRLYNYNEVNTEKKTILSNFIVLLNYLDKQGTF